MSKLLPFQSARELVVRSRGYLPHWELDNSPYFVTFRLADSLPQHALQAIAAEYQRIQHAIARGRSPTALERAEMAHRYGQVLDRYVDAGYGACYLRIPEVASVVREALHFHDGRLYRLLAWCVMPNHVHAMFELFDGSNLASVLHSWKSYTSHRANILLGRTGQLWAREYFDRLIRDEKDLSQTIQYVIDNPVNAGLRDWPWVWRADDV